MDGVERHIEGYIMGDYFRYDIHPERTSKDNWWLYVELSKELEEAGYKLLDPYIEHDCISGKVIPILTEIKMKHKL